MQGPKRPGERIYKGHKSYDLMLNLQLGIRYSVGGVHARPSAPMLLPSDFEFAVGNSSANLAAGCRPSVFVLLPADTVSAESSDVSSPCSIRRTRTSHWSGSGSACGYMAGCRVSVCGSCCT